VVHVIRVAPTESGWRVHSQLLSIDQHFQSGAKAEAAAKALAEGLAGEGVPSEIHIFLRDGTQGGTFICAPGRRSPRSVLEPVEP
jgi:hypothetical protein